LAGASVVVSEWSSAGGPGDSVRSFSPASARKRIESKKGSDSHYGNKGINSHCSFNTQPRVSALRGEEVEQIQKEILYTMCVG
jgi:hypothetical protein